jgi:hypothetical protein
VQPSFKTELGTNDTSKQRKVYSTAEPPPRFIYMTTQPCRFFKSSGMSTGFSSNGEGSASRTYLQHFTVEALS